MAVQFGEVGAGTAPSGVPFRGVTTAAAASALNVSASHATYTGQLINCYTVRAGSSAFYLMNLTSNNNTDSEFYVRGDGVVASDGGTAMSSPADYAEMFEWADGNPGNQDRIGMSVALAGDKIRIAHPGDDPIGVVSGNPAVLADSGDLRWPGKYLKDEYNRIVRNEQGERIVSPDHDPTKPYVPRRARKEWAAVGIMGKLRIRKGQQIGSRWVLMRNVSPSVDEYLVR